MNEKPKQTFENTNLYFIVEKAYVSAAGIVFLILTGKIVNTKWI